MYANLDDLLGSDLLGYLDSLVSFLILRAADLWLAGDHNNNDNDDDQLKQVDKQYSRLFRNSILKCYHNNNDSFMRNTTRTFEAEAEKWRFLLMNNPEQFEKNRL